MIQNIANSALNKLGKFSYRICPPIIITVLEDRSFSYTIPCNETFAALLIDAFKQVVICNFLLGFDISYVEIYVLNPTIRANISLM